MIWVVFILSALGLVLLWRVPTCPKGGAGGQTLSVSIIIPARNEQDNLAKLLPSLPTSTDDACEVIVVDDDSTDRTAEVARSHGAKVITAPPLAEGWRGKTWACWHGAKAATGDCLIFLDADTVMQPNAMSRIRAAWQSSDCKALSLGPYHDVEKPYEELSAVFNLLTFMGIGAFSIFSSPDRPGGMFGPFLMIDRETYMASGGHQAVRDQILENMSLAAILRRNGVPMRCLGGRGVVHTRMYPEGLGSLIEGWTKAFAAGASKTGILTLLTTVAWISGGMMAFLHIGLATQFAFLGPASLYAAAYAFFALSLFVMLRQIGRFSFWSSALYPFLLLAFFVIFFRSLFLRKTGGQVTWKGRSIGASPSGEG